MSMKVTVSGALFRVQGRNSTAGLTGEDRVKVRKVVTRLRAIPGITVVQYDIRDVAFGIEV